jgi:hypothetical protein
MSAQTAVATIEQSKPVALRKPAEIRVVSDPIAVLDTARFEHMQRIANVMATSVLIPDALCMFGSGNERKQLAQEVVVANCFLVVNQAVRWNMDPFAVAQCVSVVHGKLCYEGKLIAGIIDARLGIRLRYTWNDAQGDDLAIVVSGKFADEDEPRTVEGSVRAWKTTGSGSPWTPNQSKKMLAYRGAREWARLHAPGLMLGVYSDDEMAGLSDDRRARNARPVEGIADDDEGPPAPPPPVTISPSTVPADDEATGDVDAKVVEVKQAEDDGPPDPGATKQQAEGTPEQEGIPPFLRREQAAPDLDRLKTSLLRDLDTLESADDFMIWARDAAESINRLAAADQTEVRTAFSRRQDAVKRATQG